MLQGTVEVKTSSCTSVKSTTFVVGEVKSAGVASGDVSEVSVEAAAEPIAVLDAKKSPVLEASVTSAIGLVPSLPRLVPIDAVPGSCSDA